MLSGLAAVDPEAAFKTVTDIHTKQAQELKDQKAASTFKFTSDLYIEELPNVIASIESGKPLNESMEPIRLRLSELYRSGNIDHKAVTEQLKSVMSMLSDYKKKAKGQGLVSFDESGNVVDPLANPSAVKQQVDPLTGKVSSVGGKSSGNPLKEAMMRKVMESLNKQ
jgi:hypothetical protein